MYSPTLGKFLSRDPLSESGSEVLSPVPDMRQFAPSKPHVRTTSGIHVARDADLGQNRLRTQKPIASAYNYVSNNPLNHVDPSGLEEDFPDYGKILCEPLHLGTVTCVRGYTGNTFFCSSMCAGIRTGLYKIINAPCIVLCIFSCRQFRRGLKTPPPMPPA